MASVAEALLAEVERIASSLEQRAKDLNAQLREIEAQKRQIEASLDATRREIERASDFFVGDSPVYNCPTCWIELELTVDLTPMRDTPMNGRLRCDNCDTVWLIPRR